VWQKMFMALRDMVLLGVGAWGIIHEGMSDSPEVTALIVYALIATSPGTLAALWLGRSGTNEPTVSSSSTSPPPPSVSGP
jgi:hypothetical protein